MRPGPIEVEIVELVLHGFPPLDATGLGDTVKRELEAALSADAAAFAPRTAEHLDGPSFPAHDLGAVQLGANIAASVKEAVTM